jgi:hypothetical protein
VRHGLDTVAACAAWRQESAEVARCRVTMAEHFGTAIAEGHENIYIYIYIYLFERGDPFITYIFDWDTLSSPIYLIGSVCESVSV